MITPSTLAILTLIVHAPAFPPSCLEDAVRFCPYTLSHRTPFTVRACLAARDLEVSYRCQKDLGL